MTKQNSAQSQPSSQALQQRLFSYLRGGRVHPAIILSGGDRDEKFQIAKTMAKFLLCANRGQKVFCGECSPCRRVEKDIHPDVLVLREEGEETLKIDSIREICHQMEVSSIEGGAKICIIDECHRMNAASANAFLKTLEEPGDRRYFWLLTSQPGALLPTVQSRCLQFSFKPQAEGATATPDDEKVVAAFQEFLTSGATNRLLAALPDKENCLAFLVFLQRQLRQALVSPFLGGHALPALQKLSPYNLLSSFEGALALEGRLRSNANYGLLLESYLRQHFMEDK